MKPKEERALSLSRLARPHAASIPQELIPLLPANWPVEIPLARVSTCGPTVSIEVLQQITSGSDGSASLVYGPPDASLLAEKGTSTALILLSLLASQPHCSATRDWLSETLGHLHSSEEDDDDLEERPGLKRVDNVVTHLRHLLFPPMLRELPTAPQLRRRLVLSYRASGESGPGYRLAGLPLLWVDVDAISEQIKQARTLEQFGHDGLPTWQSAYEMAGRGVFLAQEPYSDWAAWRRQQVEAQLWDCVQALWRPLVNQGDAGETEAVRILQRYWQSHLTSEDALRPLIELLGKRECYGQAEEYYAHLCLALEQEGKLPDQRTQEVMTFLRALRIQRNPPQYQVISQEKEPSALLVNTTKEAIEKENNQQVDVTITRRQALRFLIGLPVAMLGLTQKGIPFPLAGEEILPLYVTSIPACWKLYFDGELTEVERVLPLYIEHLTPLSQQFSRYQKHAASLLSQVHQLIAEIVLQKEDFSTSLAHCKQAVIHAQMADDSNVHVASLLRQINTLFYRNRPTSQTLQEAMQYTKGISPLLRGRVYSEYAANIARYSDREQEALRFIGLAHDLFPEKPEEDPGYLYTHTTKYILFFNDTLSYLRQDKAKDAWEAITKAALFVSDVTSPRRMELLKYFIISSVALDDLDQSCLFFEQSATLATTLGLELWVSGLNSVYGQMHTKWPSEGRIKVLEALLH